MTRRTSTSAAETGQSTDVSHLLEFEKFPLKGLERNSTASDEELNSRYVKGETRIVTEQARYPLANILRMLKEEITDESGVKERRYILDPEYQRRHRWNDERKSRLIESFLMNVPVPPVFLYERDLARFEVMDGRQRLTALSEFYENKFELKGLQHWPELNGRRYSDLPSKIRDGIDRRYISSIILLKETASSPEQAATLKKIVFERLNSGGVKLSNQESRNAVYNGSFNGLCLVLSANPKFRKMWGIPDSTSLGNDADDVGENGDESTRSGLNLFEKMEDVELVLRFFAYRKIYEFKKGLNNISELLDLFAVEANKFGKNELEIYREMFESTVDFLWDTLAKGAFTSLARANTRPTKIIYDPIMFVSSGADIKYSHDDLIKNKVKLRKKLEEMYKNNQNLFSGRSTNYTDTLKRNSVVKSTFDELIAEIKN
ncbi:MAG: DUF262 domain-containing protein [Deltaproteobacteria bacterium]|jgi:hypothetical protein|nr:DUF262 domain-containing protein [Deltaproteobacteria bacterium]